MYWFCSLAYTPLDHLRLFGLFEVPTHGSFFLLGALVARWTARRVMDPVEKRVLDEAIPWMVLGATIFARAAYLVSRPASWSSPGEWLQFWRGGMVSYGGLVGALLALYVVLIREDVKKTSFFDRLSAPLLFGWSVGRFGCLLNWSGESGLPTQVPWAFRVEGESLHPVMLYLSLAYAVQALCLSQFRFRKPGTTMAVALFLFASTRAVIDTWRDYDSVSLLLWSRAACIGLILFSTYLLVRTRRNSSMAVENRT